MATRAPTICQRTASTQRDTPAIHAPMTRAAIWPSGNKRAYLLVIAKHAMQRHCGVYRSLIRTPRAATGYQPALVVLSLDAPLFAEDGVTLLNRLTDEAVDAAEEYAALYDCYLDSQP